jgi:hypothetical protein
MLGTAELGSLMVAKLLIREVGQREFVQHNGDFTDDDPSLEIFAGDNAVAPASGERKANAAGERLTVEGNVEAFEVWVRVSAKQRAWKLEDIGS